MTLSVSFNDYGFHLCSNSDRDIGVEEWKSLLSPVGLSDELIACMNLSEMAKRQFREIARVAGLVFQGFPGPRNPADNCKPPGGCSLTFFQVRARQPSSGSIQKRSSRTATRGRENQGSLRTNTKSNFGPEPSGQAHPFSFPLWAESIRAQLSTESWGDRVRKMAVKLEDSV